MEFTCPSCNVLLQAQKVEDIRLWKCASCRGLAISLPTVRKGLRPDTFRKFWRRLSSGETGTGRSCPGCRNPLSEVQADGQDGAVMIDVCRSCHILWFDDREFLALPRVEQKKPSQEKAESKLLTEADLVFAAFKADQEKRRSFLYKLLDGSVSEKLGLDNLLGDYFDK